MQLQRRMIGWVGGVCLGWLAFPAVLLAGGPLETFLPNDETVARLQPIVDRLESESFAEREAASRELSALPALPGFIRKLALTEKRAESRQRLRELTAAFPIEKENERLTKVLRKIARDSTKGQFGPLCQVMAGGVWAPDDAALFDAARATVTLEDLPSVGDQMKSPVAWLRRLAAAALSGLPAESSTAMLAEMLNDEDVQTAILAATALGERQDLRALGTFARLLEAADFQVRYRCHGALRGLTQQDFGYDPAEETLARKGPAAKWREWAASSAAAIVGKAPKDDSIVLFNGQDLQGWEIRVGNQLMDKTEAWEVFAGELLCSGKRFLASGDLWTKARFENYVLNLEYWADLDDSDSGIGVLLTEAGEAEATPKYLEIQLLPGNGGDIYQIGGVAAAANGKPIAFQLPRLADAKDKAKTWHKMRLTVRNGTVEVELNGVVVNRTSSGPQGKGRVVLRNEGSPMAFRNLVLRPLADTPAGKP